MIDRILELARNSEPCPQCKGLDGASPRLLLHAQTCDVCGRYAVRVIIELALDALKKEAGIHIHPDRFQ